MNNYPSPADPAHAERAHGDTLVLSLQPFRFATRPRKAAEQFAARGRTLFLSPSKIGRSKQWDKELHEEVAPGLVVRQLPVGTLRTAPSRRNQLFNAALTYAPLFVRWSLATLRTPADTVFATSLPLAPIAILHKCRYRSRIVIDVNERPGAKTVEGSVTSLFARLEPAIVKLIGLFADRLTTATPGDREALAHQFPNLPVRLLRNVPLSAWRAAYVPPPCDSTLRIVTVGSIFEGRAFEIMIDAVAAAHAAGANISLDIFGGGRDAYVASLQERIDAHNLANTITLRGRVNGGEVSAAYLSGDVGLALYEQTTAANDGLSNKILECVSSGRPVIAGDLPENRRFVTESGIGWLTDVNPTSLAEAIISVSQHTDLADVAAQCRSLGDTDLYWEREFERALA